MDILYYLSRDWVLGEYECWSFICDFYRREFNVELPDINLGTVDPRKVCSALSDAPERSMFEKIDNPEHGCVIEMGRRRVTHVGVWVDTPDGQKILHCRKASGGLCQDPEEVRETLTIFSYNRLRA